MADHDVIVIGAGISGLSFAWKAAQAGRRVTVLERAPRVGGCLHTVRRDGFWFELGAHTVYNSYGGLLDLIAATGLAPRIVERGPARGRFGLLRDGRYRWLSPPKVLLQLNWLEAAVSFPLGFFAKKTGQSVASYYSRLIGRRNFARVLSPFFAAVPSQSADGFPAEGAGSLFKKRPRREEFPRSFGVEGGVQSVCEAAARAPGIETRTGVEVASVRRAEGGYAVTLAGGEVLRCVLVAVAAPPDVAARILGEDFPEVAAGVSRVKTVQVESMGVVLPREKCWMPEVAFLVPVGDIFHSAVTRDPFPDSAQRAFAFHFEPGHGREEKVARMAEVLRVAPEELGEIAEQRLTLPSPATGHASVVEALDRALAGEGLALTGNYFQGLAIEDCIGRSFDEWDRVGAPKNP